MTEEEEYLTKREFVRTEFAQAMIKVIDTYFPKALDQDWEETSDAMYVISEIIGHFLALAKLQHGDERMVYCLQQTVKRALVFQNMPFRRPTKDEEVLAN